MRFGSIRSENDLMFNGRIRQCSISYENQINIQQSLIMNFQYIILIFNIINILRTQDYNSNTTQTLLRNIYGIRWFLGRSFQQYQPITINHQSNNQQSDLALMFNTLQPNFQQKYFVLIFGQNYSCNYTVASTTITSNHHSNFNNLASKNGSYFSTTIYKCLIAFKTNILQQNSQIQYQIYTNILKSTISIFKNSIRSPVYPHGQMSIPIFGDWGVLTNFSKSFTIYKSINDCLFKEIQSDSSIRLMILLGDLAYDLEGQTYINFFKQIEKFSTKIVIFFTPGNHETIKHEDLFQIYKQSFYSPCWDEFSGYFDIFRIRQTVFLGYNTEGTFADWLGRDSKTSLYNKTLQKYYGQYYKLFSLQFSPERIKALKSKTVISLSHYPMYCSQEDEHQTCSKYLKRQEPYLKILLELGVDISFAAHLHYYQRSQQICSGKDIFIDETMKKKDEKADIYQFKQDCMIFIIQGAADIESQYFICYIVPLKSFNRAFISGTGFGVLTLKENTNQKINFKHITTKECKIMDFFSMVIQKQATQLNNKDSNLTQVVFNPLLVFLFVLFTIMILLLIKFAFKKLMKQPDEQNEMLKSHENILQLVDIQRSQA